MKSTAIFSCERLIFRAYQTDDLIPLVDLCNEKTYRRWFYFLPKLDKKRAKVQIEENNLMWNEKIDLTKKQYTFAIEEKKSRKLIGSIGVSIYHGKKKLKDFEVGYDIGETYQNKGYATEAVVAIVAWIIPRLEELNKELKIVGKAEHKNLASRRVLEKAGFKLVKKHLFCHIYEINMTQ